MSAASGRRLLAVPVFRTSPAAPSEDAWSWWWTHARAVAQRLVDGIAPPPVQVWGPVLGPDEVAVMTAEVDYGRLYGGDGRYERSAAYLFGRPAVMAGALAVTGAINHRRKVMARREAIPRWRDVQLAQVIVTNQRLLCATDVGWESAWWTSVTELQPDLSAWALTLGFGPGYSPMRLSGPAAPALAVWASAGVLGQHWSSDPRLSALLA